MDAWIPALFLTMTACTGAPTEAPVAPPAPVVDKAPAANDTAFKPLTGATVSFGEPADGATVKGPVKVTFKIEGATVKPAGELADGTGHHHIIVDSGPTETGTAVPADPTHIHYGGGQTEASLELAPGPHTLTLQFADGLHRSYGPELSKTISITIE